MTLAQRALDVGVLPSIIPAKLTKSLEPFDDPAWLFEPKQDGFRFGKPSRAGQQKL
jgi:hypothetical protein